jgi:predicted nucleic acid-binding protein
VIVADTNVIAYLALPSRYTAMAEQALLADPDWIAPTLWRSELGNVLTLYLRKGLISFEDALRIQEQAEASLQDREYVVASLDVLILVHQSPCSAYDCEFVALARSFGVKLLTTDRKLLDAFPDTAVALADFVGAGR